MQMTPRQIAAKFVTLIEREQRQTANMLYAVRMAMGAKPEEIKRAMGELLD